MSTTQCKGLLISLSFHSKVLAFMHRRVRHLEVGQDTAGTHCPFCEFLEMDGPGQMQVHQRTDLKSVWIPGLSPISYETFKITATLQRGQTQIESEARPKAQSWESWNWYRTHFNSLYDLSQFAQFFFFISLLYGIDKIRMPFSNWIIITNLLNWALLKILSLG